MDDTQCIRPHMRKFYDNLLSLKKENKIHGIFMCTAASNERGWVEFLKKSIEEWYGDTIYDEVVHYETIVEYHTDNKTDWINERGVIKDMQLFVDRYSCSPSSKFVVFDDNPNIVNHSKLFTVSGYNVAVNLIEVLKQQLPEIYPICECHYSSLSQSWVDFRFTPSRFTNASTDNVFLQLCDKLNKEIVSGAS